jgi:transcriptional regulator with XRE-family HTH domain
VLSSRGGELSTANVHAVEARTVASGTPALDRLFEGGFLDGDNVIWIAAADDERYRLVERAFLTASAVARPTLFVAVARRDLQRRLPVGVQRLNATAGTRLARAPALAEELDDILARQPFMSIVIDGFAELAARWGPDTARSFFVRTCPAMLQAGAVTFWRAPADIGGAVLQACRQVTQCVLELSPGHLRVVKAEGRPRSIQGSVHRVELSGDELTLVAQPTAGRLARGLQRLRHDLGLTQAQLAAAAGVTPSAISQAESGTRGLAVDTLILISDRLGVSLDRLVSAEPDSGYRLTRHDRGRDERGVVALADDAAIGLRAFSVVLAPGDRGQPPLGHAPPQLVAVVEGLVQVAVGDDMPVLRAGDSLLADAVPVRSWQNLRPSRAALYWVVRD